MYTTILANYQLVVTWSHWNVHMVWHSLGTNLLGEAVRMPLQIAREVAYSTRITEMKFNRQVGHCVISMGYPPIQVVVIRQRQVFTDQVLQ